MCIRDRSTQSTWDFRRKMREPLTTSDNFWTNSRILSICLSGILLYVLLLGGNAFPYSHGFSIGYQTVYGGYLSAYSILVILLAIIPILAHVFSPIKMFINKPMGYMLAGAIAGLCFVKVIIYFATQSVFSYGIISNIREFVIVSGLGFGAYHFAQRANELKIHLFHSY
eukprot:TRINITY_DN1974_c0_g1_i1.p2 TRINITY_DN1974_c0_g1~~TRINITY_DN1974_c0_g1_i1.p2  ORF type:complete len:169 (+),score=20.55 TRINITY_DN1974_c0_g1_i1:62-568(+)